MLEQDYLMRIFLQFAEIIRRSWTKARKERDPRAAADLLEDAVGEATDIDGGVLLSLSPESIARDVYKRQSEHHVRKHARQHGGRRRVERRADDGEHERHGDPAEQRFQVDAA